MGKKVTDLGQEYNRESMYETAREVLMEGKTVKINGKRQKSLIGLMVEDLEMEIDKESQYVDKSQEALKEKDDAKFLSIFSKTMQQSQLTSILQKRVEKAMKNVKDLHTFNQYVMDNACTKKKPYEMSVDELNNLLNVLKDYESGLLFRLNNDCITKLTYETYVRTVKYIEEVEQELAKRHANINL